MYKLKLHAPSHLQSLVIKLAQNITVIEQTPTYLIVTTPSAYQTYYNIGYNSPFTIWLLRNSI